MRPELWNGSEFLMCRTRSHGTKVLLTVSAKTLSQKIRSLCPRGASYRHKKKVNSISVYQHFVNCCESLGAKNVVHFLDRMIVLDYIIANEDRHLNNFGLLRNAETLEWYGFAPIYDSGSSLGYDKVAGQIRSERDIVCKPFKKHHVEQLKLVSDFNWIDFDSLADVDDLIKQTLSADGTKEYIDESRIQSIVETVNRRIQNLLQLSMIHLYKQIPLKMMWIKTLHRTILQK